VRAEGEEKNKRLSLTDTPIFDINSILGLLNLVDVGNVADISEVHAAFFSTFEVIKLAECL
jgi:hypothetical protein